MAQYVSGQLFCFDKIKFRLTIFLLPLGVVTFRFGKLYYGEPPATGLANLPPAKFRRHRRATGGKVLKFPRGPTSHRRTDVETLHWPTSHRGTGLKLSTGSISHRRLLIGLKILTCPRPTSRLAVGRLAVGRLTCDGQVQLPNRPNTMFRTSCSTATKPQRITLSWSSTKLVHCQHRHRYSIQEPADLHEVTTAGSSQQRLWLPYDGTTATTPKRSARDVCHVLRTTCTSKKTNSGSLSNTLPRTKKSSYLRQGACPYIHHQLHPALRRELAVASSGLPSLSHPRRYRRSLQNPLSTPV